MRIHVSLRRLRRLALLPALALAASCENHVSIVGDVLAGNYVATSFVMTQTGQASFDVLAKGGSLTINVAADSSTTGTMVLPAGVPGNSQGGTASMKGKITRRQDGTYQFDLVESSFISALVWQQFTDALVSTSFVSNTQFQIALRK
jgi:hypothetical protein